MGTEHGAPYSTTRRNHLCMTFCSTSGPNELLVNLNGVNQSINELVSLPFIYNKNVLILPKVTFLATWTASE